MKTIIKITLLLLVLNAFQSCSKDDAPEPEPIAQPEPETENQTPTLDSQTFEAAENIADNIPIGTVVASDPDNDVLTFSISVNDGNLFEISETGGLSLDDQQTLDFETAQSHSITVAVSDGKTSTETEITITVTDIDDTSFVTTWETTSANETVTIPTYAPAFTYDYTIDWGDGTVQSARTENTSHIYETPGNHSVSISGVFPAIFMNYTDLPSGEQLRTIEQWGNIQWQTMDSAFVNVSSLTVNATDAPDLSQVTSLGSMFAIIDDFRVNGNLNNWDVSNVTDMSTMFWRSTFDADISAWDVSNVADMHWMFLRSSFNQDIGNWDVSSVTDMSKMFEYSSFNQDIGNWDVSEVTDMGLMFRGSTFNQDISAWDVSNVTDMLGLFLETPFNQNISNWQVEKVFRMDFMFANSLFNQDISNWDVSGVGNMNSMFRDSVFNQNINAWDVSRVRDMEFMFLRSQFNRDISNWDVSNVTNCNSFSNEAPLTASSTPNFTNCTF